MSELEHLLLDLFFTRENSDLDSKISVKDILKLLKEEHSDFREHFDRLYQKEYEEALKTRGIISSKDPVLIRTVLTNCLELSDYYCGKDKIEIRQAYVENVTKIIVDGDHKNRTLIRIKMLVKAEFNLLIQPLNSVGDKPLDLCIFKTRAVVGKDDTDEQHNNTPKSNQKFAVQADQRIKPIITAINKPESTQPKKVPKATPKDKMKQGRPHKNGDHNTTRCRLMVKAGIPAKCCKGKNFVQ